MHRLTRKSISPSDQVRLRAAFQRLLPGARERAEQSCRYVLRVDDPLTIVKQYTNGTLYVETAVASVIEAVEHQLDATTGKQQAHFVRHEANSWIGTDECGKGDYFGPMVVAGVWLDIATAKKLQSRGVRDSKDLSDPQIIVLAQEIRALCEGHYAVIASMPDVYNDYQESPRFRGNSARMLGWMHAQVISELLAKHDCDDIVIDKFGQEQHVLDFLSPAVKTKNFLFRHHAESNFAVAAASILARDEFLKHMDELSHGIGRELPKGASAEVERVAAEIVAAKGEGILRKIAKLHFKTTGRVVEAARRL